MYISCIRVLIFYFSFKNNFSFCALDVLIILYWSLLYICLYSMFRCTTYLKKNWRFFFHVFICSGRLGSGHCVIASYRRTNESNLSLIWLSNYECYDCVNWVPTSVRFIGHAIYVAGHSISDIGPFLGHSFV